MMTRAVRITSIVPKTKLFINDFLSDSPLYLIDHLLKPQLIITKMIIPINNAIPKPRLTARYTETMSVMSTAHISIGSSNIKCPSSLRNEPLAK